MPDVTTLERFREGKTVSREVKGKSRPNEPLTRADVWEGDVVAFDQALMNVGWVDLHASSESVCVNRAGVIKPSVSDLLRGNDQSLARAESLYEQIVEMVPDFEGHHFLYEKPPVTKPGARMSRPESSMLAALAVRLGTYDYGGAVGVSAQTAKKSICGNGNAEKAVAHKVLATFDWIEGRNKVTNEHTRDALMIALTYLDRRGRKI